MYPANLLFEVMATGTTLCLCNRMSGSDARVYESLGLRDGRNLLMFESLSEFAELAVSSTTRRER